MKAAAAAPAPKKKPTTALAVPKPDKRLKLVDTSPEGVLQLAISQGAPLEQLQKFMELKERHEANEAKKAFNRAFADFKGEAVRVVKRTQIKDGPLVGKFHANLYDVVDAVTPFLIKHGLAINWKLTKDEPSWMEVTCTLRHVAGHSESTPMGSAPDTGPGRNAIQARGSAKSYLERYTATAILGLATADNDGAGAKKSDPITEEQAAILYDTATDIAGDNDKTRKDIIGGLLNHLNTKFKIDAKELAEIPAKIYPEAVQALNAKKRHIEKERGK